MRLVVNKEAVQEWIARAEVECGDRVREAEVAAYRLSEAKKRLGLLHELLASVNGGAPLETSGTDIELPTSARVERDVAEILRDRGQPMRLQDIHTEFVRRGFPLPGRGTPTNIVAHLTNSRAVKRFGRGVYGLERWSAEGWHSAVTNSDEGGER